MVTTKYRGDESVRAWRRFSWSLYFSLASAQYYFPWNDTAVIDNQPKLLPKEVDGASDDEKGNFNFKAFGSDSMNGPCKWKFVYDPGIIKLDTLFTEGWPGIVSCGHPYLLPGHEVCKYLRVMI